MPLYNYFQRPARKQSLLERLGSRQVWESYRVSDTGRRGVLDRVERLRGV